MPRRHSALCVHGTQWRRLPAITHPGLNELGIEHCSLWQVRKSVGRQDGVRIGSVFVAERRNIERSLQKLQRRYRTVGLFCLITTVADVTTLFATAAAVDSTRRRCRLVVAPDARFVLDCLLNVLFDGGRARGPCRGIKPKEGPLIARREARGAKENRRRTQVRQGRVTRIFLERAGTRALRWERSQGRPNWLSVACTRGDDGKSIACG
ncbi:hypothetical protein MRX96_037838 [Rhipicephalus microplus]